MNSFFLEKNILITGITGFIGLHLSRSLAPLGANVYGISETMEKNNIYKINVLDYEKLCNLIKRKQITIVIHLAGMALVESGQEDPYTTFQLNINGTLNILEIARKNNLEKVIIASTAHVYGNNKLPYIEEYTPKPSRPYETSKACADLLAQSYADNFHLPVLIARFVNIYGPGDIHFNRLIPKTIKSIIENLNPTMWGDGTVRDYLYINDAISGFLSLVSYQVPITQTNRIFNFGTGNKISVKELINKIISISGKSIAIEKIPTKRIDEILEQYVSWKKAKKLLQWKPEYSLEGGLKETYTWYQEYLKLSK